MSKYQKKNSKKETTTTTKILEIDLRSWRQNIVAVFRLRKQVIANLWNLMPGFVFSSRKYNLVNFRNKKDIDIFCANKNEPRSIWLWWKKAGITCPLICDDVLKLWGQFKFGGGSSVQVWLFFFLISIRSTLTNKFVQESHGKIISIILCWERCSLLACGWSWSKIFD